jgi:hypothetical protein
MMTRSRSRVVNQDELLLLTMSRLEVFLGLTPGILFSLSARGRPAVRRVTSFMQGSSLGVPTACTASRLPQITHIYRTVNDISSCVPRSRGIVPSALSCSHDSLHSIQEYFASSKLIHSRIRVIISKSKVSAQVQLTMQPGYEPQPRQSRRIFHLDHDPLGTAIDGLDARDKYRLVT